MSGVGAPDDAAVAVERRESRAGAARGDAGQRLTRLLVRTVQHGDLQLHQLVSSSPTVVVNVLRRGPAEFSALPLRRPL